MLSYKEIQKLVYKKYPRNDEEKQGCVSEMQRMYDLREAYKMELMTITDLPSINSAEVIPSRPEIRKTVFI